MHLQNVFGKISNSATFWLLNFIIVATVFCFMIVGSIFAYFYLPSDILLIQFPTNQWIIFLLGNFGKDAFIGFGLYFNYVHWRKTKEKKP